MQLPELFARKRELAAAMAKLAAETATIDRLIEAEGLRLAQEAGDRQAATAADWTAEYKGVIGRILSAVWHAPKHRLTTLRICHAAWHNGTVSQNTFLVTLKRINRKLSEQKTGYQIRSIRSGKTGAIKGYGLRKRRVQKVQK